MKRVIIALSMLVGLQGFSQISIRGVNKAEMVTNNTKQKEVNQINNINFTETNQEKFEPKYVVKNEIENSAINTNNSKINIDIDASEETNSDKKNQLVIDLNSAKSSIDSIDNINKTNSNDYFNTNSNTTITTTEDVIYNSNDDVVKQSIGINANTTTPETIERDNSNVVQKDDKVNINSNDYYNTNSNTTITTTEDVIYNSNNDVVKQSIDINANTTTPETIKRDNSTDAVITSSPKQNTGVNISTTTNENNSGIYFDKTNKVNNEVNTTVKEPEVKTSEELNPRTITNSNNLNKTESHILNPKQNTETIEYNNSPETLSGEGNLNKVENFDNKSAESENINPMKGSWSVGLKLGIPAIIGDVKSKAGFGTSLSIQKALGHMFSLRFQALFLETYGMNSKTINNNYDNYKTRFSDYTLQGVITLNNLSFYKKTPKVLYNIIVGGGLATRYTWKDLNNANGNAYSYDVISTSDNKTTRKELNELLDHKYESHVPKDHDKMSIKNTNILPTLLVGMGLDIKLSEKFDVNLETRFSNHFDDNLDGLKNGTKPDWMTFTSLGLTYKFGSKSKSLRWTNPVYSNIEELNELKKKVDEGNLLKDEDKDGIADLFDQDLNTPARVAVDSRGIPSDIDKDGVPDYKDAEPFTPIGAQVDAKGVALDADNDGVPDILDLENNTASGNQVDANGSTISIPKGNYSNENNFSSGDFGLVLFNENSSKVKSEFYSELYRVSKYITANPNARIQIIGYTDVLANESYNLDLSEKRANAVYSMLIGMFSVPSNNLSTSYEGENNPIVKNLPESKDPNLTEAYYINRRVEFRINK